MSYFQTFGTGLTGQFWYGKSGFLYKKSGGAGGRKNPSLGLICNKPTYIYNKYKPGTSGVGASTIANRRAKNRLATVCTNNNCGKFYNYLGLGAYYQSPFINPFPEPIPPVPPIPPIPPIFKGTVIYTFNLLQLQSSLFQRSSFDYRNTLYKYQNVHQSPIDHIPIPFITDGQQMTYTKQILQDGQLVTVILNYQYYSKPTDTNDGFSFDSPQGSTVNYYNSNTSGLTIVYYDGVPFSKGGNQFKGLIDFTFGPNSGTPKLLSNTTLKYCFFNCINFNQSINNWDYTNVTNMSYMFSGATSYNQPIYFNTSASLLNLEGMFKSANTFNQHITFNDTSNVTTMASMFEEASVFDKDIGHWNVSNVVYKTFMFKYASEFNNGGSPSISNWKAHSSASFTGMFWGAIKFNQPLPILIDMSKLVGFCRMDQMFEDAVSFDQDVSLWDLSKCNNMKNTFKHAHAFNNGGVSLDSWSAKECLSFESIFESAISFDQPLSNIVNTNSQLVTPDTVTFAYMFYNATKFNRDIGGWNVSNVIDMTSMFHNATAYNNKGFDSIKSWNAPLCASFASMFEAAVSFDQPLTNLVDTTSLAPQSCSMSRMFYGATNFNNKLLNTINLWKTDNVSTMASMFQNATAFNQPINTNIGNGSWITTNVTNMSRMFYNATNFNKDIGDWNVSNVTDMTSMFQNASAYNNDNSPSITSWNAPLCASFASMFEVAVSFNQPLSQLVDTSSLVSPSCPMSRMFYGATNFNKNIGGWIVTNVTDMTSMFQNASAYNNDNSPSITSWNAPLCTSFASMFEAATLFDQPLSQLVDTTLVSSCPMARMFYGATLFNRDIGGWIVIKVTDMTSMFQNASAYNNGTSPSISNWNAPNCISFTSMFEVAVSFDQPLTNLVDTTSLTSPICSMSRMFYGATNFNKDISSWKTDNVTTMASMFQNATVFNQHINTNSGYWSTQNVTTMANMFASAIAFNQNVGGWDVSNVTTMINMFNNATLFNNNSFGSINNWITSNVTNMSGMFASATNFNQNIGSWITTNVTDMSSMFKLASNFNQPINTNSGSWITTKVTNMSSMFSNAFIFNQNIGSWDVSNVTTMSLMFNGALAFNNDSSDTIKNWDTSKVTMMDSMFKSASVFNRDLSSWNVFNVTTMTSMFQSASAFNNGDTGNNGAKPFTNWTAPSCTSFSYMFNAASVFNQHLPILVKTANVTSCGLQQMFNTATIFNNGDTGNNGAKNMNSWDTKNVTSMYYLFAVARAFNQDVSGWDVSKTTSMESMFNTTNLFNNGDTGNNGAIPFTNWEASSCTTFLSMFQFALSFNQTLPKLVKTDGVTSCLLSFMFYGASIFNNGEIGNNGMKPINSWNTINVTSMANMFQSAVKFNQQLDGPNWSTQNVTTIASMFQSAIIFNNGDPAGSNTKPLNWITDNVTTMLATFVNAPSFNQPINTSGTYWNTGKVTTMFQMFGSATLFNQPIGNWDVSKVTSMFQMFYNANAFNQPIGAWNTVSVTTMGDMFRTTGVNAFNQDISLWNVSNVTIMSQMFLNATVFNNGTIGNVDGNPLTWSAPKCTTFASMFQTAKSFNQNVSTLVSTSTLVDPSGCDLTSMFNSASLFNNGEVNTIPTVSPQLCTSTGTTLNCPSATLSSQVVIGDALLIPNLSRTSAFVVTNVNSNTQLTISPAIGINAAGQIFNVQKVIPITSTLPSVTPLSSFYTNTTKTLTCPGATFISSPPINVNDTLWIVTSSTIYITTVQSITNDTNLVVTGLGTNIASGIINIQKPPPGTSPLNWNTSNVTNMNNLFRSTAVFNQSLSSFNTSNVNNMGEMFRSTSSFNQSLSNFNTSNVTTIGGMFNEAKMFNQPINTNGSYWDTSNITNMSSVFQSAQIFNQSLSLWNTYKVTTMNTMFFNAFLFNEPLLTTLGSIWDVSNVTNMSSMFASTTSFNNGEGTNLGLFPLNWSVPACTSFATMFNGATAFNQNVGSLLSSGTGASCSLSSMFNGATKFNNGGASGLSPLNWDTSKVTNMSSMFQNATVFNQYIGLWTTNSVTSMISMFASATAFNNGETTDTGANQLTWSAPLCITFALMFSSASNFNQPLPNLVQTNGLLPSGGSCSLDSMFLTASKFNQNVNNWNVSRVTKMSSMFNAASAYTNGSFALTNWQAPLCTTFASMFQSATVFNQPIPFLVDTSILTDPSGCLLTSMFQSAPVFNQDISNWIVLKVKNMSSMFNTANAYNNGGSALTWYAPNCITFGSMFLNAYAFNQPITTLVDTSNVTGCSLTSMFQNTSTTTATSFNKSISNWNVSRVTSMNLMFARTTALNAFNNGSTSNDTVNPLTSWQAPLCTTFANMFQSATLFNQAIPFLVDTSILTDPSGCNLSSMFVGATIFNNGQIGTLDISGNFSSATYTNGTATISCPGALFNSQLTTNDVLIITSGTTVIYTSKIQRIISDASLVLLTPYGATLTPITTIKKQLSGIIDLSWNTINVTNMTNMFNNAYYFNQNIRNWNVSKVTNMTSMFAGSSTALKTTFNNGQLAGSSGQSLDWTASRCTTFTSMFQNNSGFNQPISALVDISGNSLNSMFQTSSVFNQNINTWNTSNVTTLVSIFSGASVFNNGQPVPQNISGTITSAYYVNTGSVLNCPGASFTTELSIGDVLLITTPTLVYSSNISSITNNTSLVLAIVYGSNIGTISVPIITSIKKQVAGTSQYDLSWNTQNVTNIASAFQNATYFNQRLPWNTNKVTNVTSVFAGTLTTFINLFNNGQIITGTTQRLYPGIGFNIWDFNGNTITGGSSGGWRANSRLIMVTGNGVTTNPVLT